MTILCSLYFRDYGTVGCKFRWSNFLKPKHLDIIELSKSYSIDVIVNVVIFENMIIEIF